MRKIYPFPTDFLKMTFISVPYEVYIMAVHFIPLSSPSIHAAGV